MSAIRRATVVALVLACFALPAAALDVLVSNDDGFETANLRALQQKLKAAGHRVIVAAPTQNQSGRGGFVNFLAPIPPLATATRYATVAKGAPGVGADPSDADVFYVDGTPVMSLLYGLDVAAPAKWGKQPDLVISGPNEGNNTGLVNNSSGTVANALYAINRGVPAIAVSYQSSASRVWTALTPGATEYELADVVLRIVDALERQGRHGDLLPPFTGLNVNVPTIAAPGASADFDFDLTRIGRATSANPVFYARLGDSPTAVGALQQVSPQSLALPGVSVVLPGQQPPAGVVIPADTSARSEQNAVTAGKVAISVLEGVPQADLLKETQVRVRLRQLFR